MRRLHVLPTLALAGALLSTSEAGAEPATHGVELAPGVRYGLMSANDRWDPFGFGIGLDAGYTFSGGFHLGGIVEYFFGREREWDGWTQSGSALQFLGGVGFDFGLGEHLVLRPELDLGLAKLGSEVCPSGEPCSSSSYSAGVMGGGAKVLWVVPHPTLFVGGRYELVVSELAAGVLILTVGGGY